jgi:hypothetical protein
LICGDSSFNVCLAGSTIKAIASGGIFCATEFVGSGANLTGTGFSPDADKNLLAGDNAGQDLDGSNGCYNVLIGQCAGKDITTGGHNVFIGAYVGCSIGNFVFDGSNHEGGDGKKGECYVCY